MEAGAKAVRCFLSMEVDALNKLSAYMLLYDSLMRTQSQLDQARNPEDQTDRLLDLAMRLRAGPNETHGAIRKENFSHTQPSNNK